MFECSLLHQVEELLDTRGLVFSHDLRLLSYHLPGTCSSYISGKLFFIPRLLIELLPQRVGPPLCVDVLPASLCDFLPGRDPLHPLCFCLPTQVMTVQIKCFQEIITIGYRVYRSYELPWFRTLSW